jgi:hypothetical protein
MYKANNNVDGLIKVLAIEVNPFESWLWNSLHAARVAKGDNDGVKEAYNRGRRTIAVQ